MRQVSLRAQDKFIAKLIRRKQHTKKIVERADTELERTFDTLLKQLAPELPEPLKNYRFDLPDSLMEIDRYFEYDKVGIELNGGTWTHKRGAKSGHNSGTGIDRDYRKLAIAHRHGIKLFFFSTSLLAQEPEWCIDQIKLAMELPFMLEQDRVSETSG